MNDEDFIVSGGEAITFNIVKVDVCGFKAGREVIGGKAARGGAVLDCNFVGRYNNAAFKAFEFNMNLYAMELEGSKGKGLSGVLGEPEGKGDIQDTFLA